MIEWTQDLSTGSADIDNQHKELFRRINAFLLALQDHSAGQELGGLLNFLQDYVLSHFSKEELLMDAVAYPDTDAHKAQHRLFIARLNDLKERLQSKDGTDGSREDSTAKAASDLLVVWLKNHIMILDKDLGPYGNLP